MPSSSSESTFADWRTTIEGWFNNLKNSVTLPSLVDSGAGKVADAFDSARYADTGTHFSSSDKATIKSNISSGLMQLFTGAANDKIAIALDNGAWNTPLTLTPTGVEHKSGPTLSLSAGVINWKIGGTPSVKWDALAINLIGNNFSDINPVNNLSALLSITYNNWELSLSGSYKRTLDAPSASRDHELSGGAFVVWRLKY